MKKMTKIATTLLLAGGMATTAYLVQANESNSNDADVIQQANVTLYNAVEIALQAVPGNVIAAKLESEDSKVLWEVEVLAKNNQAYDLEIDAISGKVLKQSKDENDDAEDNEHEDRD